MIETKFLSIDIGSNAMRASVAVLDQSHDLEVLETFRYPLRLGEDTFSEGRISKRKFKKTESAFADLLDKVEEFHIDHICATATSAIRDAENGAELIKSIQSKFDIEIEMIDGLTEANLIAKAVSSVIDLNDRYCLLIDIGGGSTELIVTNGLKVLFAKSYQCGTVRLLEMQKSNSYLEELHKITKQMLKDVQKCLDGNPIDTCVGTGGNLRRIGKLRNTFFNRHTSKIFQSELVAIKQEVESFSIQQRIHFLSMRPDRADVIVPALQIIEDLLLGFDIPEIQLPTVGLKEGSIINLMKSQPRTILS